MGGPEGPRRGSTTRRTSSRDALLHAAVSHDPAGPAHRPTASAPPRRPRRRTPRWS